MGATGSVMTNEESGGKSNSTSQSSHYQDIYNVKFKSWTQSEFNIPKDIIFRISKESVDFLDPLTKSPIVQFPFQIIVCWGSSRDLFQFNIFKKDLSSENEQKGKGNPILLSTNEGKKIEDAMMKAVKRLMSDMEVKAMSKFEFDMLLSSIHEEDGSLVDDWMRIVDQFTSSRRLIGKQAMELVSAVDSQSPFDKMELICLVFDRVMNKESFQLVINSLEDIVERENIIKRLQADKKIDANFFASNGNVVPEL